MQNVRVPFESKAAMKFPFAAFFVCAFATAGCAAPNDTPLVPVTQIAPAPASVRTFQNPLKVDGADPCLFFHNGYYYLSTTTAVDVKLRRAKRIVELKDAPDVQVWKDDDPSRNRDIWAPEFHLLDAKDGSGPRWYLYYTASSGPEPSHRMYVAQSASTDPMGPYSFKAKLLTDRDDSQYAIDGTVLSLPNGEMTFAWCGRPSPHGQGLFLSKMTNPWTLGGERTALEASGFGAVPVREGPEFLVHGDKVFLVYSMCGASTPDYRLSALVASTKDDLSAAASWTQHPKLLLARADQNNTWGPGHNFFFKSPDGTQDWIVYHGKTSTQDTYADRTTRAQPIRWRADGTPDFGVPVSYDDSVPVPSGEK